MSYPEEYIPKNHSTQPKNSSIYFLFLLTIISIIKLIQFDFAY
jgi:hypothetical protein